MKDFIGKHWKWILGVIGAGIIAFVTLQGQVGFNKVCIDKNEVSIKKNADEIDEIDKGLTAQRVMIEQMNDRSKEMAGDIKVLLMK